MFIFLEGSTYISCKYVLEGRIVNKHWSLNVLSSLIKDK